MSDSSFGTSGDLKSSRSKFHLYSFLLSILIGKSTGWREGARSHTPRLSTTNVFSSNCLADNKGKDALGSVLFSHWAPCVCFYSQELDLYFPQALFIFTLLCIVTGIPGNQIFNLSAHNIYFQSTTFSPALPPLLGAWLLTHLLTEHQFPGSPF